jgi:phosphinothricin acetyltransferase
MSVARVRDANGSDLPAIGDVYSRQAQTSRAAAELPLDTRERRSAWFDAHDPAHPVLVAEMHGEVVAWASLSRTAPDSEGRGEVHIYVRDDRRGHGLGHLLLSTLVSRAREHGHRSLVSRVPSDLIGSITLHRALGFVEVAAEHDAVNFELALDKESAPSTLAAFRASVTRDA